MVRAGVDNLYRSPVPVFIITLTMAKLSILASASPIIEKFRSTACLVLRSIKYISKVIPLVKSFMLPMASRISWSNDGISLSDMNQAFFHERKITGLDGPAGNKINFLFEQVL